MPCCAVLRSTIGAAEEARWRAELREREAARLLVLESEWRRRERSREAEIGGVRAEYLALEERAQKVGAGAGAGVGADLCLFVFVVGEAGEDDWARM